MKSREEIVKEIERIQSEHDRERVDDFTTYATIAALKWVLNEEEIGQQIKDAAEKLRCKSMWHRFETTEDMPTACRQCGSNHKTGDM